MNVLIKPKSQRAKNRVNEHGVLMDLKKEENGAFLVESLNNTFNKNTEKWVGWFRYDEAEYELAYDPID